jgi:hypothetical protein
MKRNSNIVISNSTIVSLLRYVVDTIEPELDRTHVVNKCPYANAPHRNRENVPFKESRVGKELLERYGYDLLQKEARPSLTRAEKLQQIVPISLK